MTQTVNLLSESLASTYRERIKLRMILSSWWFERHLLQIATLWIARIKALPSRGTWWDFPYLVNRKWELHHYAYRAFKTNKFIFWLSNNKFIKQ